MKNRLSSHLLLLLGLAVFEIVGYAAIHRAALIRGYETSLIGAARDLLMYFPIIVAALWISIVKRFRVNWTLFTTAILLFSIGLLVQYRLYSDPEYNAKNKAVARRASDLFLPNTGPGIMGETARAGPWCLDRHGGDSLCAILCAERLWPDADFQRRLRDALPGCGATLATASGFRRLSDAGYVDSGGGRPAPRHSGKVSAAAHGRPPDPARSAGAYPAAVSPVAGWFRSALARRVMVEERLRRGPGNGSAHERFGG